MKYLMIFAILITAFSCKQNPAETPEHKELVASHVAMEYLAPSNRTKTCGLTFQASRTD